MTETDRVLDVRAGQFAVVTMATGRLRAVRVSQVWEPGEDVLYCGRDRGPAEVQMVSLEKLCLARSSTILRVIDSEIEARVFALDLEVGELREELLREREAHARSRDRLRRVHQVLAAAGTVSE